jgi:hypothetical protein
VLSALLLEVTLIGMRPRSVFSHENFIFMNCFLSNIYCHDFACLLITVEGSGFCFAGRDGKFIYATTISVKEPIQPPN